MSSEHKPTLRVLSVLDLVAHHSYKYTFTEISHVLDIPASTLFPIIHTLREQQYLSFDERTQTYALGIKLFELGSMIQNTDYFSEIIDVMHTVVDGCGETCHFGVLSGGDVLYLAKVDSPHAIRMYSMAGRRLPAYTTAIGKALLRDCTLAQLHMLYPNGLVSYMPNTITNFDALYRQLSEIKKNTFAYENEESNASIRCIALPICTDGRVSAALSVAIPVFRYSEDLRHNAENLLRNAAGYIERILPYKVF